MPTRPIEALSPGHRHAQTPAQLSSAHQFYEWFYFEVEFADTEGKPWRIITSLHYPHGMEPHRLLAHQRYQTNGVNYFNKFGDNPKNFAGIASYVVDVNKTKNIALVLSRFPRADIPGKVVLSKPGAAKVSLKFGDSSFVENANGSYTLTVKQKGMFWRPGIQRDLRLDMKVTFTQNTPGFQPPSALLIEQGGVKHHWACVMPNPTVMVEHAVLMREVPGGTFRVLCAAKPNTAGHGGYHDHQWGDDLIYKQIERWNWGRVSTGARGNLRPRDKVLFFDVVGVASPGVPAVTPDPVVVEVPGNGNPATALQPVAGAEPFAAFGSEHMNFADGCRLGIQGQNVPYDRWIYLRTKTAGGQSRNFNVEHKRSTNVDTWPFYLRFCPAVYDFHSGRTFSTISEVMHADRMPLADCQKVLVKSDKITVWE